MKISLSHIIVAVCLFKGLTEACQIEGENKKNGKVFYSVLGSTFGKVSKYNLGVVELKNCAQDIQISKTVELPSPQNFSTESWLSETATNERNCRIESEKSPLIKIFKDPSPTASQLIQLSEAYETILVYDKTQIHYELYG